VPPPSSVRPGISPALDRIVLRALERTRERRYHTADEFARDCDAVLRDERADGQTLRAFLNDLFTEESSSLSLEVPELPEELFADAVSAPVPSDSAVPRDDQSIEIEVIDRTGRTGHGRVRTPAPPFGVIAADGASLRLAGHRIVVGRRALIVGAVGLAAVALVSLGLARQHHHAPRPVATAAPVRAVEAAPIAAREPAAVVPAPAPPADVVKTGVADKPASHHHRRRALSSDLTLNPF
jgi:hypothetical protein